MDNLVVGILAHVDAGKTTLSESLLYKTGITRALGRVDHKDAFLDTAAIEKKRGITVFSKQAVFDIGNLHINLLDTPGHIDFSSEMERTLSVLDYAILVISAPDGIQKHTKTLIDLLAEYDIPTFVWVNKMDICQREKSEILAELNAGIGNCVDFNSDEYLEGIAMADEDAVEKYLKGKLKDSDISELIRKRLVIPCCFGSALKQDGVDKFIDVLSTYAVPQRNVQSSNAFGAKVYKITRDENGNRLTHIKVTSGSIKVRDTINDEKITQIRVYNGAKFSALDTAVSGNLYALCGLDTTFAGQGLGLEDNAPMTVLVPSIAKRIVFPAGINMHSAIEKFRMLSEENPDMQISWDPMFSDINLKLYGNIQAETLRSVVKDRFGLEINFDSVREWIEPEIEEEPEEERKLYLRDDDFDINNLEAIMLREFGPIKRPSYSKPSYDSSASKPSHIDIKQDYLIVDGYNVIFAWDELKELAKETLNGAAESLVDILKNYSTFKGIKTLIVFDAYKVKGGIGSKDAGENLSVVYTREGESADFYIEKLVREIGKSYLLKIVTSDAMIQLAAVRAGVMRISASEFAVMIKQTGNDIEKIINSHRKTAFRLEEIAKTTK